MTRSQRERIYGMRELTRILTLTPKRTAQLRRLELLHGESGYTFRDLLALRAASALLDAGASVRQIKQALAALRRQDPSLVEPLAELKLVLEGDRLLAQSDRVRFDPRSGQLVLALDEGGLEKAASGTHTAWRAMPGLPGAAKSAETRGLCAIFQASACSRPPPPMIRIRITFFAGRSLGLAPVGRLDELEVRSRDARPGALRVELEVALPVSDRLTTPLAARERARKVEVGVGIVG